jgi:hypothetical protein
VSDDLVQDVAQLLNCPPEKAQAALGAVLTSVRMSMDAKSFGEIREKHPKVESWMGRALTGGGRTGEMLALVGPGALKRNLKAAGLEESDMIKLGGMMAGVLKGILRPELYTQVETRVPLLKGSLT